MGAPPPFSNNVRSLSDFFLSVAPKLCFFLDWDIRFLFNTNRYEIKKLLIFD